MSELEEKLGGILSNPQIMQQIAAMAQTLGKAPNEQPPSQPRQPISSLPDPSLLQGISKMLEASQVDQQQQELLHALSPFLCQSRINKLERAMRAAKMAGLASVLLKPGGSVFLGGR